MDGRRVNLLLDTHIWIWASSYYEKLGGRVRREIQRAKNELYLSPISIWEAELLARRKRIRLKPDFPRWLESAFSQIPIREAPVTFAVSVAASQIQLPASDPGDVFLAATASTFDFTLVTSDAQLLACSWLKTLSNDRP
jgi:PIN domain nuclease of toxin-antitoxin system